jgi:hypothetical protein
MFLNECKYNHWYEIIDGCSVLKNGTTILYEKILNDGSHFVISDHCLEETGIIVSNEKGKQIFVEELFF